MNISKLKLRTLCIEDEVSFRQAVEKFKSEEPSFHFAFGFDESEPFSKYVEKLNSWSKGDLIPEGFVPNTFLVGIVDSQVVGRVSIRHCLNEALEKVGGHIGYGVVSGYRRKGYATEMLRQALPICSSLGLEEVLITCDCDNSTSMKIIERCGGVFESEINDSQFKVQKRRYWITL